MSPTKRRLIITLVTLLLVAMVPAAVMAAGTFDDDDGSIFESHIEWLASAGVTLGCNPAEGNTKFCPNDNVTRGQMAAFMRRFAQYLDAEDGTPALADEAADARLLDGKNAIDFQPNDSAFDTADLSVSTNGTRTVVEADISTTDGSLYACLIGAEATADIRVHASATVTGLGSGEEASFRLTDEDGSISGSNRYVASSVGYGNFAIDWLYELVPGGDMTFSLENYENSGDTFTITNAVILVEVLSDTRCKGGGIIIFPNEPAHVSADDL